MKAKLFVTMAAAALVLASCSKDENETIDNWNGEIRLSSGVAVQTRADAVGAVPDTQIASGEKVGIYVAKADGTDNNYTGYTNVSATADGNGNFSDYSTLMYYPQTGKGVKISAYHPYYAEEDNEYDFTVKPDQSVATNYYASDLLYSASETAFERSNVAHSLTFVHKLSKITCDLIAGPGIASVKGATVEVCQAETAVKFNRITGVVSIALSNKQNVTLDARNGAIIAPQTIAANTNLLKVTLSEANGGASFYYKVPAEGITFNSGSHYTYNITVNATGLTVSSTINKWNTIGTVEGNAEME